MANLKLKTFAVFLAMAAFSADAQVERAEPKVMPVEELKTDYLKCDRLSSITLLDFETAAYCSTVNETLLVRGFNGDFNEMLKWWRSARTECGDDPDCAE